MTIKKGEKGYDYRKYNLIIKMQSIVKQLIEKYPSVAKIRFTAYYNFDKKKG